MTVLLIGATGKVGRPILRELLGRGHDVVALVRDPSSLADEPGPLTVQAGDLFADGVVSAAAAGCSEIVSSVALRDPAQRDRTPLVLSTILAAAADELGVRWLSLGGAGSLDVAPGRQLVDEPTFPDVARPESLGFREALHYLRDHAPASLQWTVISPPISIVPDGPRTGAYRTELDTLVRAADGSSAISAADLAVAVVDELDRPAHPRERFAVGY